MSNAEEKSAEDIIRDMPNESVRVFAIAALIELQDQIGDTYGNTVEIVSAVCQAHHPSPRI
jgi:hypothetical protein